MNKVVYCVLLLAMTFSGCQKLLDYYHHHDRNEPPDCKVLTITDKTEDGTVFHTVKVNYNAAGLPESVEEQYSGEFEFGVFDPYIYDDQNRLIAEGPFSTEVPHMRRYVYEGNSQLPVRDTLYSIAHVYVEDFEYDDRGRIIRQLRRLVYQPGGGEPEEPDEERKYFYDARGNRQEDPSNPLYPGVIEYSDKPSLYSLSPVWQIQYRDFSRNATLTGKTFNKEGLPLTLKREYSGYFQPFLEMNPGAEISYECK